MVVLTNKKDKKTTGFLMTLVPDKAYYESTHFNALRSNYKQWQKGYSGYVFYHTLDGKFINAWKFADGKVIKEVTQVLGADLDLNMGAKKKVASDYCIYTTYGIWSINCTYWTFNNSEYNFTTCGSWYYDYTITVTSCYDDGNNDDGGNEPEPPTTGGTANDPFNGNSPISTIVETNNLNTDNEGYFNNALRDVVYRCGYNRMFQYLKDDQAFFNSVSIDGTKDSGYDCKTGNLTFRNSSEISTGMKEEFIHFFQDNYYQEGMDYYIHNANFEFEAKLMIDLLNLINDGGIGAYFGDPDPNSQVYTTWLRTVTDEGTHFPSYEDLLVRYPVCNNLTYWDFLSAFAAYKPGYNNLPIVPDLTPRALPYINSNPCY